MAKPGVAKFEYLTTLMKTVRSGAEVRWRLKEELFEILYQHLVKHFLTSFPEMLNSFFLIFFFYSIGISAISEFTHISFLKQVPQENNIPPHPTPAVM